MSIEALVEEPAPGPNATLMSADLEEQHPFVSRYDPLRSLDSQVEFPLREGNLSLFLNPDNSNRNKYLLGVNGNNFKLSESQAVIMTLLMMDKAVSINEIKEALPNSGYLSTSKNISELNDMTGHMIKSRYSLCAYIGDDVKTLRTENISRFLGYSLNSLTGYFFDRVHDPVSLTMTEADLMKKLIRVEGAPKNLESLRMSLKNESNGKLDPLTSHIKRLNKKIKPIGLECVAIYGIGYKLRKYTPI